jgi:hypothetical protein
MSCRIFCRSHLGFVCLTYNFDCLTYFITVSNCIFSRLAYIVRRFAVSFPWNISPCCSSPWSWSGAGWAGRPPAWGRVGLEGCTARRTEAVRRAGNPASRMPPYRFTSLTRSSASQTTSTTPSPADHPYFICTLRVAQLFPWGLRPGGQGRPPPKTFSRRRSKNRAIRMGPTPCGFAAGAGLVWSCALVIARGRPATPGPSQVVRPFKSCEKGGDGVGGQRPGPDTGPGLCFTWRRQSGSRPLTPQRGFRAPPYTPPTWRRCVAASRPISYCMSKIFLRISHHRYTYFQLFIDVLL